MSIQDRLDKAEITIPTMEEIYGLNPSGARYITHRAVGETLYLTGTCAAKDGKPFMTGILGEDLTVEQGYQAARQAALCNLGILQHALGDLERVVQFIQLIGHINSGAGFTEQPRVLNGASDLFLEVFGDKAWSTRAAIGCRGIAVNHSVELILTVQYDGGPVTEAMTRGNFAGDD
ncbi:MAG: RidA family protein [Pseudomonadota bacterium]